LKVFLSHSSSDKHVVEPFALALRSVLGQENVFYDSWSIQPGDGIIDRMNQGLADCDFFFLFISEHSLTSEMVKMEWQNALMAEAKKSTKLIPVKIDQCKMPAILLQKLYVDAYSNGIEIAIRQVIDVIKGDNTYKESDEVFHNLRAFTITAESDYRVDVEIRAISFMEPISRFLVVLGNDAAKLSCLSDGMVFQGQDGSIQRSDGKPSYLYSIRTDRATAPGFPFRFSITDDRAIEINEILHAVGEEEYEHVPMTVILPDSIFHLGGDVEVEIDKIVGGDISQREREEYFTEQISKAKESRQNNRAPKS